MTFEKLTWIKGRTELVQGIKGNSIPYNAIRGGNGSFVVAIPAKLILTYDGGKTRNIIFMVKQINGWKKLSQKRFDMLEKKLKEMGEFNEQDFLL